MQLKEDSGRTTAGAGRVMWVSFRHGAWAMWLACASESLQGQEQARWMSVGVKNWAPMDGGWPVDCGIREQYGCVVLELLRPDPT